MTGEQENDRCYFCGGKLESRITLLPFVVKDNVVIVKNICSTAFSSASPLACWRVSAFASPLAYL